MNDVDLASFHLVGGTALALIIGHRRSIDIDLFTTSDFDAEALSLHLSTVFNAQRITVISNGVFCYINEVKTDILAHKYPLQEDVWVLDDIRCVSLRDIGAMKLHAIYSNGTRLKDFVDVYFLLEKFCLNELVSAFGGKYPNPNLKMVLNSITYFNDIDFTVPIDYIKVPLSWDIIEDRLMLAARQPHKLFAC